MFGFPADRHVMKIAPFTTRLISATKQLKKALESGDTMEMARGIEDVGFWTARTTAELISGQEEGEQNLDAYKKGLEALFQAQREAVKARKRLGETPSYGFHNPADRTGFAVYNAAKLMSGPILLYAASKLESKLLANAVALIGVGIVSSYVHGKLKKIDSTPVLSTSTEMIPYSKIEDE